MVVKLLVSVAIATVLATPVYAAGKVIGSFKGHCDGFNLTLKNNGAVAGVHTGCGTGRIAGLWTDRQIVLSPSASPPIVIILNAKPRNFFVYDSWGKLINKGKWKPTAPLSAGAPPSFSASEGD